MVFYNVDSASDVTISLDSADTGELTLLFAGALVKIFSIQIVRTMVAVLFSKLLFLI